MESMVGKLLVEQMTLKLRPNSKATKGYMYFYMAECKRMKGDGTQSGSVKKDVRSKWNSMSDAEKEPYITQSRNDRVILEDRHTEDLSQEVEVSKDLRFELQISKDIWELESSSLVPSPSIGLNNCLHVKHKGIHGEAFGILHML
ncbi:hypothetical protein F3Y22_tig00110633pilonHSYRG00152 [Hibiscus syriacus]|uniref:HMG box domain-containing protein n=1 Tax=Hibiscus syriacus TaxID=106335 RepID=A0A6A3A1Q4_HIBSY|nr:hypothetical protein F3Y22_tig00110633pilonHSYRG00152 [Hibiscus syriacus]